MSAALLAIALAISANADTQHSPDGQGEPFAWFLTTKETPRSDIRYCVIAANSSDKEEIKKLVIAAVAEWADYFVVTVAGSEGSHGGTAQNEYLLRDSATANATCKGDEELTVYYGVEDARVKAAKALYDNPLGFAHNESYDDKTGSGRGFIWISDAPEVRMHVNHRRALLTHELGHVFGVPHVSGTIMEENIADVITSAWKTGKPFAPQSWRAHQRFPWINFERELAGWTEIEFSTHLRPMNAVTGSDDEKAIRALNGTALGGLLELRFERLVPPNGWNGDPTTPWLKGHLALCRNKCGPGVSPLLELDAEYGQPFWLPLGDEKLFRWLYHGQEWFLPHQALITPGAFVDAKSGRRTEFVMSRNGNEIIELYLLVDGEKIRLL